ncbi:MAG: hypothetical protein RIC14_09815 [Filomicrobium sp.]
MSVERVFGRKNRSKFDYSCLAQNGLGAEWVGLHKIKIVKDGHFVGLVRKVGATYFWYPAGYHEPEYGTENPDDVVGYLVRNHGVGGIA